MLDRIVQETEIRPAGARYAVPSSSRWSTSASPVISNRRRCIGCTPRTANDVSCSLACLMALVITAIPPESMKVRGRQIKRYRLTAEPCEAFVEPRRSCHVEFAGDADHKSRSGVFRSPPRTLWTPCRLPAWDPAESCPSGAAYRRKTLVLTSRCRRRRSCRRRVVRHASPLRTP